MGSLFSPILVFAALKLMSAIVANVATGGVSIPMQCLMIAFAIVALQAPGMMIGAIAASFPSVAGLYFAGRLIGGTAGNIVHGDWAVRGGGGGSSGGGGGNPNVRMDPPRARGGGGPNSRTTGSGRAASGKLASQTA
jgi:hypothetical protein